MKPPCSGDMGFSPGPLGKVEGLGILTIWEPGPLGLDFWKPSRLTQRYTPATAGPLTRDTCPPQDKCTLSHSSNAQHPCSGWTHSNDHLCVLLPGVPLESSRALGYSWCHRRTPGSAPEHLLWFVLDACGGPRIAWWFPPALERQRLCWGEARAHAELCGSQYGTMASDWKVCFTFLFWEDRVPGGQQRYHTTRSCLRLPVSSRPTGMTRLWTRGRNCGQHNLGLPRPLPGGLPATSHASSQKEQVTPGDGDGTHPLSARGLCSCAPEPCSGMVGLSHPDGPYF